MTGTTLEPLAQQLRELLAELAELDPDAIGLDAPFVDVGIDSLLAMEVAVHVESRFGVRFDDGEVKQVQTLREMAAIVDRERNRGG